MLVHTEQYSQDGLLMLTSACCTVIIVQKPDPSL